VPDWTTSQDSRFENAQGKDDSEASLCRFLADRYESNSVLPFFVVLSPLNCRCLEKESVGVLENPFESDFSPFFVAPSTS